MWYKCLNPICGFVFTRTGECYRCPDCGKECLREATDEEVSDMINHSSDTKA